MRDPWLPVLQDLPLTRTEKEVVKRYEADPEGRSFLPVADILRSHKLLEESLELLNQGVVRHPTFTVARVVLSRELFQKGMIQESWATLEDSPVPLRENVLAQKLKFKIAAILGKEEVAKKTKDFLKTHQMLDQETKQLSDLFEVSGLDKVKDELLGKFKSRGVQVDLNSPNWDEDDYQLSPEPNHREPKPEGTFVPLRDVDLATDGENVSGFHVVSLGEIFKPKDAGENVPSGIDSGGIELDSTTLAEIYEKQGHFAKALNIYRRLIRISPQNAFLQKKVAELTKLDREQKDVDLTLDPGLVDRMETVEIIDRQMRYLTQMLNRLESNT